MGGIYLSMLELLQHRLQIAQSDMSPGCGCYVVFCKVHDVGSEVSLDLTVMATVKKFYLRQYF